ncbi:hypothetical protein [Bradyrhizobium pachyrhizi]|uniref:hypothetical protein n=1 Tax=Bradyrhizobium pachyrhizi TaxID=280333 RepID=UPI001874550B|nr:hypothetical protein [Bradyrhizobium pachyrhizi]
MISLGVVEQQGRMPTQAERISKKIFPAAGLRPELTFTSVGRHGGTTEASMSGLTKTRPMKERPMVIDQSDGARPSS